MSRALAQRRPFLHIVRRDPALPAPTRRTDQPWGPLAEPVDPLDTLLRMRAQSILTGKLIGQCPPLTLAQAKDVIAWHHPAATA